MKRKVTMRKAFPTPNGQAAVEAVDYPDEIFLDAYVADARTRWAEVIVGDYDNGPGGPTGRTWVPKHLNHPLAGKFLP